MPQPDNWSLVFRTHMVERADSQKLSFNFKHELAVACAYPHTIDKLIKPIKM